MNAYLADPQAALPRLGTLAGRVRVLVAGGAKDIVLPAANARLIKQALPGAELVVYANGGHGFLFQERLEVRPARARFPALRALKGQIWSFFRPFLP